MKKFLVFICIVLLLVTGCGKVPKLSNGEDAVITSSNGDISVNELYNEVKDVYALNSLIDLIDLKLLEKDYPSDKDESNYIDSQLEQLETSYKNS